MMRLVVPKPLSPTGAAMAILEDALDSIILMAISDRRLAQHGLSPEEFIEEVSAFTARELANLDDYAPLQIGSPARFAPQTQKRIIRILNAKASALGVRRFDH